jgi:hypothetical protein
MPLRLERRQVPTTPEWMICARRPADLVYIMAAQIRQGHPAETSAATRRDTPSDTSASEIRPRARPIRGTRPPYRSLVHLPRRMSFRLPVPPLNRLLAYVLVDEGQRPRAGVHLAVLAEPAHLPAKRLGTGLSSSISWIAPV